MLLKTRRHTHTIRLGTEGGVTVPRSLVPRHKRLIVKLVHAVTGLLNNTSSCRKGGVALSLAHAALHATIHALCPSMMSCIFFAGSQTGNMRAACCYGNRSLANQQCSQTSRAQIRDLQKLHKFLLNSEISTTFVSRSG